MKFIEQCRTHNTPQQTIAHNRTFSLPLGTIPTPQQTQGQLADMALEKVKPQFQRREIIVCCNNNALRLQSMWKLVEVLFGGKWFPKLPSC